MLRNFDRTLKKAFAVSFRGLIPPRGIGPRNLLFRQPLGIHMQVPRPAQRARNDKQRLFQQLAGERRRRRCALGFTLLELMIVITIIMILLALGAGRYQQSVVRAKEAALHQDLTVMRKAIDQYTLDKLAAPQSLEDLVGAGYLREIPVDPITGKKDWQVEFESDVLFSPEQTSTGIVNVRSASDRISPFEGTAYNSW